MTKLALINPGNNPEYSITEPLNLGFLASYAIRKIPDLDIIIIDELAGDDVFTKISEFHPDFIGITGVTPLINRTYELARFFGDQGYTIILGGPHASALPEEAQKYATYVIVGEGEEALVNIIKGKESEGIVTGSPINTLDDIPPPARHLLHMDYYMRSRDRNSSSFLNFIPLHSHVASIISSRGCPFNCCFCHNSFKDLPYRYHSPERIVQEIKELINNFNVNAIFFIEDNFFSNQLRAKRICELIINEKINIIWGANARVNGVSPELLSLAKEAGCRQITFGFESGSQRILDIIGKKTTVEQARRAIQICNSLSLGVNGTFIIGNPTETIEELDQTIEFIKSTNITNGIGICYSTPYPGTKLWSYCVTKGLMPSEMNYDILNYRAIPVNSSRIPDKILKEKFLELQQITSDKWNGEILLKEVISFQSLKKIPGNLFHPKRLLKKIKRLRN